MNTLFPIKNAGIMIKRFRERMGLSVEQFAQKCGVSDATIYNLQSGNHLSPKTLQSIADAFDMKVYLTIGTKVDKFMMEYHFLMAKRHEQMFKAIEDIASTALLAIGLDDDGEDDDKKGDFFNENN